MYVRKNVSRGEDVVLITTSSPTYYVVSPYSLYLRIRDKIIDKTTT